MSHILIADDEPMVLRVYKTSLQREGYTVETVGNGELALAAIRARQPDALITDIEMPKLSGEQLCRQIAAEIPDRRFPIIVQTSLTADQHRSWSAEIDNLAFMEKPISLRKLMDSLRMSLASVTSSGESHG